MGSGELEKREEEAAPFKQDLQNGRLARSGSGQQQLQAGSTLQAKQQLADQVARATVRCGLLILTWYVLSTALGLFNKKLVGKKHGIFGNGAFPAPLLLTGVQFAFQHVLARLVFASGFMERSGRALSWRDWSRLVLPNGAVTGMDIGFSNASLVHITMSFYTMCKSTTPIFLLMFAFLWGLETPSWGLAGVVAVIVSGLLLLVQGESEFDATGFALVMSASCMSGLRFTLTQLLLHGRRGAASEDHAHSSPFGGPLEVLEVLTPVMSATLLLLSLATERLWATLPPSPYFATLPHALITLAVIFAGAFIAFLMVWTEYQVIKETSALTFMIAGTVKEVVTVITAVIVFGDKFGLVNGVGLVVVIAGVLLFNLYKLHRLKQSVRERIASRDGAGALDVVAAAEAGDALPADVAASAANGASAGEPAGAARQAGGGRRRQGPEGEEESEEVMRALEFEPLLPIGASLMVRR